MNKITLLIDHPRRDLLFSSKIKDIIGEKARLDLQDGYFTPQGPNFFSRLKGESLIVTPSYNVNRSRYITLRKLISNSKLILFHSEQFITENDYEEKLNLSNIHAFNTNVDLHLVWGQYYADILMTHGIPKHKIKIVGNPKFQLIKEYSIRIPEESQKCILFVSNFNYAEFSDEEWDDFKKEYSLPEEDKSRMYFSLARATFIKSIIETSNLFPEEKVIVRLHPAERENGYFELEKLKNVEVSRANNIMFDLRRSKIVFQYTSSVIFEAHTMGVPCFAILFFDKPQEYMQPPSESFIWYKPKDIEQIIKHTPSYAISIPPEKWTYYFSDVENSCEEIATILIAENDRNYKFNGLALVSKIGLIMIVKNVYCFLFTKTWLKRWTYAKGKIDRSYSRWLENDHNYTLEDLEDLKLLHK